MKDNHLQRLQQNLTIFGLNPRQWKLQSKGRHVLIRRRGDEDFVLSGTIDFKSSAPAWKSICLHSI